METEQPFDFIIVGAGSAGCVLANRLSANPAKRVLLLEAGPEDTNIWLKIPAGFSRVFQPGKHNWGYFTTPQKHLNGRKIYWPRGKTLGGSSSINGMVYLRGHPEDYDGWAQLGCRGWAWEDVVPYFVRGEDNTRGASAMHGVGGELGVCDNKMRDKAAELFMASAAAIGTPFRADLNDGIQHGTSRPQTTVRGRYRSSTATAFLHPIRSRPNLVVACNALAQKIIMDGRRAIGVRYRQHDMVVEARCSGEVILSGGVINSPQLLMLSGIGPADHLRQVGIKVVHDLKGVGQNLQDHFYTYYTPRVKKEISANHHVRGWGAAVEALKYVITGKGYLNMSAVTATAFAIVGPGATRPDVEISFRPVSLSVGANGVPQIDTFSALNASCSLLRPQARGTLELVSNRPEDAPRIDPNYCDNEADLTVMREGMRWIRRVFEASPMAEHVTEEIAPGKHCQNDADWEAYIRATSQTVYHPVGTCKMGLDDRAVVDPQLRVHGIQGLRVVDASIMPSITSSNTNAPTIMIAEKAADMILAPGA
jgi:choline dehydrogenase